MAIAVPRFLRAPPARRPPTAPAPAPPAASASANSAPLAGSKRLPHPPRQLLAGQRLPRRRARLLQRHRQPGQPPADLLGGGLRRRPAVPASGDPDPPLGERDRHVSRGLGHPGRQLHGRSRPAPPARTPGCPGGSSPATCAASSAPASGAVSTTTAACTTPLSCAQMRQPLPPPTDPHIPRARIDQRAGLRRRADHHCPLPGLRHLHQRERPTLRVAGRPQPHRRQQSRQPPGPVRAHPAGAAAVQVTAGRHRPFPRHPPGQRRIHRPTVPRHRRRRGRHCQHRRGQHRQRQPASIATSNVTPARPATSHVGISFSPPIPGRLGRDHPP